MEHIGGVESSLHKKVLKVHKSAPQLNSLT